MPADLTRPPGHPGPGHDAFEVVVVGAGVVGAALALALAEAGVRRIALVEWTGGAPCASDISGGLVRAFHPDPVTARQAAVGLRMLAALPQARLTRGGSLHLLPVGAVTERDLPADQGAALLSSRQAAELFPAMAAEPVASAVWEPAAGWADPARLTAWLLTRAEQCGVHRIRTGTPAGLLLDDRGCAGVLADGAELRAHRTVLATGAWTPGLLAAAGLDPAGLRNKRIQYDVFTSERPAALPSFVDDVADLYGRPLGPNEVLVGTTVADWDVDPEDLRPDAAIAARAAELLRLRWPGLGLPTWQRGATAADCYRDDGPLGLTGHAGTPGLALLTGGAGGGFKLALPVARAAADLLAAGPAATTGLRPVPPPRRACPTIPAGSGPSGTHDRRTAETPK